MHRLGIVVAACALLLSGIVFPSAQPFSSFPPGTFNSRAALNPAPGGGGFTGPIDINGTAFAFWSTRCGATAYTGNVVDIWDAATGSTTETLVTCSSGGTLNTGSPTALATTCAVSCNAKILYDQSGSAKCSGACNLTIATNSQRPIVTTSCQNSLMCLVFTGANSSCLQSANTSAGQAQTMTWSSVYNTVTNGGFIEVLTWSNQIAVGTNGANVHWVFAGLSANPTATDGSFHAAQDFFNGASSASYIDGSNNTGLNAFTQGIGTGAIFSLGGRGAACVSTQWPSGKFLEAGIWAGDKTTNNTTMNSSAHTAWAF